MVNKLQERINNIKSNESGNLDGQKLDALMRMVEQIQAQSIAAVAPSPAMSSVTRTPNSAVPDPIMLLKSDIERGNLEAAFNRVR